MELALFDLDHTLIATDSSAQWWHFMKEMGWISDPALQQEHDRLMALYDHGLLDMDEYLQLTLKPLKGKNYGSVCQLAERFVAERLLSTLYPAAEQLVKEHQQAGHCVLIVSASEEFIVKPWQQLLQVDAAIGVGIETREGFITGNAIHPITYREGKVTAIQKWLQQHNIQPSQCHAYSDSHNDIAMLEFATKPIATNPNKLLTDHALVHGWPQVNF